MTLTVARSDLLDAFPVAARMSASFSFAASPDADVRASVMRLTKLGPKHVSIYVLIDPCNPLSAGDGRAAADTRVRSTARDIIGHFRGLGLDYCVTGAKARCTLEGVSRMLKHFSPQSRIVVAETGGSVDQPRSACSGGLIDAVQFVTGTEAQRCARDLAVHEGIACVASSGAAFAAALKVARDARAGSTILVVLPAARMAGARQ